MRSDAEGMTQYLLGPESRRGRTAQEWADSTSEDLATLLATNRHLASGLLANVGAAMRAGGGCDEKAAYLEHLEYLGNKYKFRRLLVTDPKRALAQSLERTQAISNGPGEGLVLAVHWG